MGLFPLFALSVTAFLAAALSSLTGVAGGVILLSGLLLIVPAKAVVPLHGCIQFCAGASRMLVYRHHIDWAVVFPFILSMLPGAGLGAYGLTLLFGSNPSWLLLIIAVVVIYAALAKPPTTPTPIQTEDGGLTLLVLGFSCGFLGMFVGSTGPLVSGWLLRRGIVKEAHIASKSVMQGMAHLVKLPLFAFWLDFNFTPYAFSLLAMGFMVVLGTMMGRWALDRVSVSHFNALIRVLLGLIALRIIGTEVPLLF